jgi:hypothetical protein
MPSTSFTFSIDGSLFGLRAIHLTHNLMPSLPVLHLTFTRAVSLQATFTFPDTFSLSFPAHSTSPDGLKAKLPTVSTHGLSVHSVTVTVQFGRCGLPQLHCCIIKTTDNFSFSREGFCSTVYCLDEDLMSMFIL